MYLSKADNWISFLRINKVLLYCIVLIKGATIITILWGRPFVITSPNKVFLLYATGWHPFLRTYVPLVEFIYLVFTRMPGESYRRRLRSLLLYLCHVFRALINSLVCWVVLLWACVVDRTLKSSDWVGICGTLPVPLGRVVMSLATRFPICFYGVVLLPSSIPA